MLKKYFKTNSIPPPIKLENSLYNQKCVEHDFKPYSIQFLTNTWISFVTKQLMWWDEHSGYSFNYLL